ncbi:MAG: hypothetical protein H6830_01225 [Planctomycetes bacterium]|nr:hypothetical protein [Planctomycetota bacterium]MCB9910911.1 hypothetical protein [Planctomycetota bacterium]MCB9912122.1 hypothetical protein [Planctomycetota bacterium]HPF13960.1 hypothetical protein [Planctomycetota bacterium]
MKKLPLVLVLMLVALLWWALPFGQPSRPLDRPNPSEPAAKPTALGPSELLAPGDGALRLEAPPAAVAQDPPVAPEAPSTSGKASPTWAVQVFDADGRAVPDFRLYLWRGKADSEVFLRQPIPGLGGTTDADGILEFDGLSDWFAAHSSEASDALFASPIELYLMELAVNVPVVPGEEPMVLRLPPGGSLEFSLFDEHDQPWTEQANLEIQLGSPGPSAHRPIQAGFLRIPYLPLDQAYSFRVKTKAGFADLTGQGTPLGIQGTVRRHRLRFDQRAARLTAQLQTAAGVPWSEETVALHFGGERPRSATTTQDGRCEIPLREGWVGAAQIRLGQSQGMIRSQDAGQNDACQADIEIPVWSLGDVVDLGVIVLDRPPVVVAGKVFDPEGRPIARAPLEFLQNHPTQGWILLGSQRTGRDGSFAFRGNPDDAPFAFQFAEPFEQPAFRWLMLPADALYTRGELDIRLRAQKVARIRGRIAGIDDPNLTVFLRYPNGWGRLLRVQQDGTFSSMREPAGTVEAQLLRYDQLDPLASLAAVTLTPGRPTDERLNPWQVSDQLRRITVHVEGPEAGKWAKVRYRRAQDGSSWWMAGPPSEDHFTVLTQTGAVDLEVTCEGWRPQVLENVPDAVEVLLEPAPEVLLNLSNSVLPPGPSDPHVAIVLWPDAATAEAFPDPVAAKALDSEGRRYRAYLPGVGTWIPRLVRWPLTGGEGRILPGQIPGIRVGEQSPQTCDVRVDAGWLEETLEVLRAE